MHTIKQIHRQKEPIAILGAGAWGTALAVHLARFGHSVCLWSHEHAHVSRMQQEGCNQAFLPGIVFPEGLAVTVDLETCVASRQAIVIALPSHVVHRVLARMVAGGWLANRDDLHFICATKGLDQAQGRLMDALVALHFGKECPFAVLSGPSFALEVAQGKPTRVMAASHSAQLVQRVIGYFSHALFRVDPSSDVVGIELASVVKNVLAIAVGLCDGLALGYNARSALIMQGIDEMKALGVAMGGQPETFMGLAGLGDVILTCTGDLSRNRKLGLALGRGETQQAARASITHVVEGAQHLDWLIALGAQHGVALPIIEAVKAVLSGDLAPKQALHGIFKM